MPDIAVLEQQRADYSRAIANLETQVKALRDYITVQENNLRSAPDSVRHLTERGLAEARSDLSLKDLRLQQVRQDLHATQAVLGKAAEIKRKETDIETLERERDRISMQLDRTRADLAQLNQQFYGLASPAVAAGPEYALVIDGKRIALPSSTPELLVGCADTGVFPDVDLTAFGGTASGASRRHALLRSTGGTWSITDLNTTNGTFVNGTRIASNVPIPLGEQSKVRFGGIYATFESKRAPAGKTTRLVQ